MEIFGVTAGVEVAKRVRFGDLQLSFPEICLFVVNSVLEREEWGLE